MGKSCSFDLLCVSSVNVYQFCVCPSFPFGVKGGMWYLIVLIPDYCLSIYFTNVEVKIKDISLKFPKHLTVPRITFGGKLGKETNPYILVTINWMVA